MEFLKKTLENNTPIDLSLWFSGGEKGFFVKRLSGLEANVFRSLYAEYAGETKDLTIEERVLSGARAIALLIVDSEGNAVFTEDDLQAIMTADLGPLTPIFNAAWLQGSIVSADGFKKK